MQKEFYSNGKLLLSGEYAILDGALGLAIPTKYGQSLQVVETSSGLLEWKSFDNTQGIWFNGTYELENLNEISVSDKTVSGTLCRLLQEAKSQNPKFMHNSLGTKVETQLNFPRKWGLGTSSTLINNIAQWAGVDAYKLLWNAFGGSGYDIACAKHNKPILYRVRQHIPKIEEIAFNPAFKDSIFFVYLNKKQRNKEAIAAYRNQNVDKNILVSVISSLTKKMASAASLNEFESLVIEHEETLSTVLGLPPVKTQLFPDYQGTIKSLGGWGGDFIMATGFQENMEYFRSKGYKTVIPYTQMGI